MISSATYWCLVAYCLASMCLFSLQIFFLVVDFYIIVLWSEMMLDMISAFLSLLRFVLWPSMWSVLENVQCTIQCEKNVCSASFGWNVPYILITAIWSNMSFMANVSSLIFCLDDLSIDVSVVLKFPTIMVILSVSPFIFVFVVLFRFFSSLLSSLVIWWPS